MKATLRWGRQIVLICSVIACAFVAASLVGHLSSPLFLGYAAYSSTSVTKTGQGEPKAEPQVVGEQKQASAIPQVLNSTDIQTEVVDKIRDSCSGRWHKCSKRERSVWAVTLQAPRSITSWRMDGCVTYLEYAYVMLRSLIAVGTRKDIVVLHADDVSEEDRQIIGSISPKIKFKAVEGIKMPIRPRSARHANTLTKLHVFNLTEYDKVVSLDLDMFFNRNSDRLFCMPAFAAAKTRDHPRHRFNSGLFIAKPNTKTFLELVAAAMSSPNTSAYGEQPLLRNRWPKPKCLPSGFNCRAPGGCDFSESDSDNLFIVHGRMGLPTFGWRSYRARWGALHDEFLKTWGSTLKLRPESHELGKKLVPQETKGAPPSAPEPDTETESVMAHEVEQEDKAPARRGEPAGAIAKKSPKRTRPAADPKEGGKLKARATNAQPVDIDARSKPKSDAAAVAADSSSSPDWATDSLESSSERRKPRSDRRDVGVTRS